MEKALFNWILFYAMSEKKRLFIVSFVFNFEKKMLRKQTKKAIFLI